ncbi:FKBP-type peptidyl-prolyl cis-trans isomerase [Nitrincola alkalilacustris]|uniref:FKBP-type peptidyl-prolyl cis-trans isomerase n=1 Tax=Nitrincola alkalilacustris TaxID=1571224 RepID=UPI00124CAB0A|nr:FKBP-type peptidyl-prolyl cis-trans isomerase [Nitrincola alkalilacustris]
MRATALRITADYRLLNSAGECLDQSTPEHPMRFVTGQRQVMAAIEQQLSGCSVGDEISITLTPEQAFGPHRPELVFEAVRQNLPPDLDIVPGMTLIPGGQTGRFELKVLALTEKGALLDGNHPLAGQTLTWEIKILDVAESPEAEEPDIMPIRWV